MFNAPRWISSLAVLGYSAFALGSWGAGWLRANEQGFETWPVERLYVLAGAYVFGALVAIFMAVTTHPAGWIAIVRSVCSVLVAMASCGVAAKAVDDSARPSANVAAVLTLAAVAVLVALVATWLGRTRSART